MCILGCHNWSVFLPSSRLQNTKNPLILSFKITFENTFSDIFRAKISSKLQLFILKTEKLYFFALKKVVFILSNLTIFRNERNKNKKISIDYKYNEDKTLIDQKLRVFTTRQDTIFGATFCAISPNHPLAELFAEKNNSTFSSSLVGAFPVNLAFHPMLLHQDRRIVQDFSQLHLVRPGQQ